METNGWIFLSVFWTILLVGTFVSYKIILSEPAESYARGILESEVHHETSDYIEGDGKVSPPPEADPTPGDGQMP